MVHTCLKQWALISVLSNLSVHQHPSLQLYWTFLSTPVLISRVIFLPSVFFFSFLFLPWLTHKTWSWLDQPTFQKFRNKKLVLLLSPESWISQTTHPSWDWVRIVTTLVGEEIRCVCVHVLVHVQYVQVWVQTDSNCISQIFHFLIVKIKLLSSHRYNKD